MFVLLLFASFGLVAAENEKMKNSAVPTVDQPVWQLQTHPSQSSLRGLFVVDHSVAWASGSQGTVIRSLDGGRQWHSVNPAGADELDFRDVHAFDADRALAISAGSPARVYQTSDGGENWTVTFADDRPQVFFDAMDFWDRRHGLAFSDPIGGRLFLIETSDGGESWHVVDGHLQPATLPNEAGFAASGTCLCVYEDRVWIGLGGQRARGEPTGARILRSEDRARTWTAVETPIVSGEASGVFSIAFANRDHGVAVGGTYTDPDDVSSNVCITDDGGASWRRPSGQTPSGYRSCVATRNDGQQIHLVCVGRNGSDVSSDYGETWRRLDGEPFHAVAFSPDGNTGIAVGREGKIGVWKSP